MGDFLVSSSGPDNVTVYDSATDSTVMFAGGLNNGPGIQKVLWFMSTNCTGTALLLRGDIGNTAGAVYQTNWLLREGSTYYRITSQISYSSGASYLDQDGSCHTGDGYTYSRTHNIAVPVTTSLAYGLLAENFFDQIK